MTERYRLSFTTGGLFLQESAIATASFLQLGDWTATRAQLRVENLLQVRTSAAATRISKEVTARLQELSSEELSALLDLSLRDQANLLWVAVCRRYPFIREFAIEVLREHFLVLRRRLVFADFDHFLNAKALWHAELDDIAKSTQLKLRQNLFRMLREADLLSDQYEMLLADTMRELVSYAVGCMLGRYSLDKPGLILANQGETLADYLAQVPEPSFPADDDNVIPLLDGDWFADDITLRFRQFLRVAFGEEHYDENLAFIEQALNVKGKRNYSLRDYFLSEFYADHVKRYKKRPIYWLFSSPKGSFNALIYMHRYRPDTVSVVLKYLRDYREKLSTEKERQASMSINPATSQGDKTRALKEVDRLAKVLAELEDYERDVLYPKATEQIAIDLDDGVKVNYLKFGAALKKIVGLDVKEED